LVSGFYELDAFKATARAESVKAFLTMLEDYYRRSYGRVTLSHPRSIVFAATTNEDSYLIDPTGNRRFWPIKCGKVDVTALRDDVEQLWAEAKQAYFDGELWWLDNEQLVGLAATEQELRLIPDSWEEYAESFLNGKNFVQLREIYQQVYDINPVQQSQPNTARIQRFLRQKGFHMAIQNGVKGYAKNADS